jgi:predicted RND superfamily exporter protein
MLKLAIVRIVDLSTRYPWWIIMIALILSSASAVYVERHFAIKTDINELISPDLPWARRVAQFVKEFPQREILIVIDAPTPEFVEQAATKIRHALEARPDLFLEVRQPQSGSFFRRNGLLYLLVDEVKRAADQLVRADALIGTLAADPSLR